MLVPTEGPYLMEYSCKYESSSTYCLKVISKVKSKKNHVELQGQGHSVKSVVFPDRSSHKECSCEMSKLTLYKLLAR